MTKLVFNVKVDSCSEADISHTSSFEFSKPYIFNKKLLNVGCWTGNFEQLLKDFPCNLTGMEIEEKALSVAKKNNRHSKYVLASILRAPFHNQSFDVVMLWMVLEHLPMKTEAGALKEINRLLKEDGYLILTTPNSQWMNNFLDVAHWMKGHRHYKVEELEVLLRKNGFEIEKVSVRGGFFHSTAVIVFYIFKHIFNKRFSPPPWLNKLVHNEFKKEGFTDIYIIAKKAENF